MNNGKDKQIKVIDTGMAHGTITVTSNMKSVEVTQTRSDIETDGRHAVVQFQADWAEDAARRDFTVNAIYLDSEGKIFDPLDGRADLMTRRLRFVGAAADRVREDALRMLRFCRFSIDFDEKLYSQKKFDLLISKKIVLGPENH